jgi:hypothetical protein
VTSEAVPTAARKRRVWPWVLGGVLVFLGILAGLIFAIVSLATAQTGNPAATVLTYDRAYKEVDCELYESVTTAHFRDDASEDGYDCDEWTDIAASYTTGGIYYYKVKVKSVNVVFSTATVVTDEIDNSTETTAYYDFKYSLTKPNGKWVISAIDDITPE